MPRISRVVVPGFPHHITQRGNRRQKTFFCDRDYQVYIELMAEWSRRCGLEVWAYCLMPNHIHLIAVPETLFSLRQAVGEAHRRYTRQVNFRKGWRGHLWQGRFASYPMDEQYLLVAARYVELNPVRAGLADKPELYPWSSAGAHMDGIDDRLVTVSPLLEVVGNWREFLNEQMEFGKIEDINCHERTGRPLGSTAFIKTMEQIAGRVLLRKKPGPKVKIEER